MAGAETWEGVTSRRLLLVADGVAAAVVCVLAVVGLPDSSWSTSTWLAAAAAVVAGTTVAWRRFAPFAATIVALTATLACQRLSQQPPLDVAPFAIVLDTYMAASLGFARGHWRRVAVLVVVSLGILAVLATTSPGFGTDGFVQAVLPVTIGPTVAGAVVAWRRDVTRRLDRTRALLEDELEMRVTLSALDERRRLARELHDVVAHAVTVMAIQAGAARLMLADNDQPSIRARLERIVTAGRDALADLGRLASAEGWGGEQVADPLIRLSQLTTQAAEAGLGTDLVLGGTIGPISEELVQVVHRIVQEALTNAVKHTPGGSASVTLRSTTDALAVTVVSRPPSPARGVSGAESGGRGLVGMGERVRAHGGVLRAGPRSDGSFEVAARIPLTLDTPTGDGPWWRRSGPGARWRAPGPWRGYAAPVLALAALELDVAFSNQRRGPVLENVLIAAAMAVALRWRVRRPLAVCLVITALAVPLSGGLTDITQATVVSTFVFVVPVYSVAAWAAARPASVGLVAVLAMILGVGLWHGVTSSELVGNLVMTIALWVVGRLIQAQRRLASSYEAACAALLAERAARQRQQAHHERIRVVSDLETSVRHDVTAMVALAESALDDPSARSGEAIASIETTARTALAAMREIVGVLRPAGELLGEAAPDPVAV